MNELSGMNGMPEIPFFSRFFCYTFSISLSLSLLRTRVLLFGSLTHSQTVRFAWNLLININVEMVTRIMVFAFLSFSRLVFRCVCNFVDAFFSPFLPSMFDFCAWCVPLFEFVCFCVFLPFLFGSFTTKITLTLCHIFHTSFFLCVQLYYRSN